MVKKENKEIFQGNLLRLTQKTCNINKEGGTEYLDKTLRTHVSEVSDFEKSIEEFHEVLKLECSKSFRTHRAQRKQFKKKSVPWWTQELTIMRKRSNALRLRYQRARNNEELREQRKTKYLEAKARYEATIKKGKVSSWKQYCNMTSSTNPWKEIRKLAGVFMVTFIRELSGKH